MHAHEWQKNSSQHLAAGMLNRWSCLGKHGDGRWCIARAWQHPETLMVHVEDLFAGTSNRLSIKEFDAKLQARKT